MLKTVFWSGLIVLALAIGFAVLLAWSQAPVLP